MCPTVRRDLLSTWALGPDAGRARAQPRRLDSEGPVTGPVRHGLRLQTAAGMLRRARKDGPAHQARRAILHNAHLLPHPTPSHPGRPTGIRVRAGPAREPFKASAIGRHVLSPARSSGVDGPQAPRAVQAATAAAAAGPHGRVGSRPAAVLSSGTRQRDPVMGQARPQRPKTPCRPRVREKGLGARRCGGQGQRRGARGSRP
jgi:hypothetical protein